jgi:hypothetical protein
MCPSDEPIKALQDQVAQLTSDMTALDKVNVQLQAILERELETKLKSGYKSTLADAASKANTAWPLPGYFEGGRRR